MRRHFTNLAVLDLPPGEIYLARSPMLLQTLLGSCVSATLWNARLGIGALSHGVLPVCPYPWGPNVRAPEGSRYVDFGIRSLVHEFRIRGSRNDEIQIKLFGGADVLPIFTERSDKPTVGALNAKAALEVIASEGLQVQAYDLKGNRGRRIFFNTGSGEVFVRKLEAQS